MGNPSLRLSEVLVHLVICIYKYIALNFKNDHESLYAYPEPHGMVNLVTHIFFLIMTTRRCTFTEPSLLHGPLGYINSPTS